MRKALIVGIDAYPGSPLNGCVNDAVEFAKTMERNEDGSLNFEAKLLKDVPTKAKLRKAIIDLFKSDSETALFYFSGHGYISDLGGYVVTPDHERNDVGVSMDEILIAANASEARNRVIILDCCYSGAFGAPHILGGQSAHIAKGVTVLSASRDNEPAMEVNGHGVFTNLLLNALEGGAADLNGNITPGSIYAYIDQALGEWDQRPVFKTNVSRFNVIKKTAPGIKLEVLKKLFNYFPTATELFALDPSYEDTNTPNSGHHCKKPYANPKNIAVFKNLQKMQSVGLVVPIDAEFMYFAAMESKACKLTRLGQHYWRLIKGKKI